MKILIVKYGKSQLVETRNSIENTHKGLLLRSKTFRETEDVYLWAKYSALALKVIPLLPTDNSKLCYNIRDLAASVFSFRVIFQEDRTMETRDSNWNGPRSLSFRLRESERPDRDLRNCLFRYVVKAERPANLYTATVLLLARISPIRYAPRSRMAVFRSRLVVKITPSPPYPPLVPGARWITVHGNSKYRRFFASSRRRRIHISVRVASVVEFHSPARCSFRISMTADLSRKHLRRCLYPVCILLFMSCLRHFSFRLQISFLKGSCYLIVALREEVLLI